MSFVRAHINNFVRRLPFGLHCRKTLQRINGVRASVDCVTGLSSALPHTKANETTRPSLPQTFF
jgi:hypothetical protein